MGHDPLSTSRISMQAEKSRVQANQRLNAAQSYEIIQEAQADDFLTWSESLNPVAVAIRRFDTLESRLRRKPQEGAEKTKTETEDPGIAPLEMLDQIAKQFEEKNPELHRQNLQLLRARIKPEDSVEDILKKLTESYPDHYLANEALDFLQATSTGELAEKIKNCKEKFNQIYQKEIRAGQNISGYTLNFSKQGLNSPTKLREDMKSKGPSIERAELQRLLTETRSLQAILGVYRYFQSRMHLIGSSFARSGMIPSTRITFELLAKLFVKFLMERYPSADKILQLGMQMGLEDQLIAELIIFTQMRDAVRHVAPRLFKNESHRQEVLKVFMETLEELEEQLDEEDDDEEKEEKS